MSVKLYSVEMTESPGSEYHWGKAHYGRRVWLTGEYRILSDNEVKRLKRQWNAQKKKGLKIKTP